MSNIFQQVISKPGIIQYRSSAYHPESQIPLERFHQNYGQMENMMGIYCFQTEKDWDNGVHLLLFAVREANRES